MNWWSLLLRQKMVKNWIVYCSRLFGIIEKNASAGAGAIVKNWSAVRKCVRNNFKGAKVRAPHSKNPRNPTSVLKYFHTFQLKCFNDKTFILSFDTMKVHYSLLTALISSTLQHCIIWLVMHFISSISVYLDC